MPSSVPRSPPLEAILHTLLITAVALPLELVLGLVMAQLFLDHMPGRQLFIALIVLPTVISPMVAGATWRLMFDQRYGPVNQIISWLTGRSRCSLWTVTPSLVYPAILICGDLAVDAVHVPDPAGGAVQCRPLAARGGRARRRRLLAHLSED